MYAPPRLTSGETAKALACTGAVARWPRFSGRHFVQWGFHRPISCMLLRSPLLHHLLPFLGPYLFIRDDDDEDNDDDDDDDDDDEEEEQEEEDDVVVVVSYG